MWQCSCCCSLCNVYFLGPGLVEGEAQVWGFASCSYIAVLYIASCMKHPYSS